MISPEVLRKYEFFGFLSIENMDKIAMFSDEVKWAQGETVFKSDSPAKFLFLLEAGEVELKYRVEDTIVSEKSKEFYVGQINPGEPFGLSSIIDPYKYTAACVASQASQGIKVDGEKLREMAESDPELGYGLMTSVAKAAFDRLTQVSQQLVAAR